MSTPILYALSGPAGCGTRSCRIRFPGRTSENLPTGESSVGRGACIMHRCNLLPLNGSCELDLRPPKCLEKICRFTRT